MIYEMKAVRLKVLYCLEGRSGHCNTVQNIVRGNLNAQALRDRSQRIVNTGSNLDHEESCLV